MPDYVYLIISCVVFWLAGMVLGYLLVRWGQADVRPWNWRVLVGPCSYYAWLEKRNGTSADQDAG